MRYRSMLSRLLLALILVSSLAFAGQPSQTVTDSDYRVLAKSQRLEELWPQLALAIAKNSEAGLRDRISREVSSTASLSPETRDRALAALPSVVVAARNEFNEKLTAAGGEELLNYIVLAVYPKHITPAEASTLAAFYRSAPGAKMLRLTPVMIAERKENPAADPIVKYFSSEEIAALNDFSRRPVAQKISAVGPRIREEINRYFAERTEPVFAALAKKYAAALIAQAAPRR